MKRKLRTIFYQITNIRRLKKPVQITSEAMQHDDFDEDFYLNQYPDVALSKMPAYFHYINHGKTEGRFAKPFAIAEGKRSYDERKENVLLVCHQASRTGAPILALNISEQLCEQFNVIVILLEGGRILPFFEKNSFKIYHFSHISLAIHSRLQAIIQKVHTTYPIKFSIVNSIVSALILETLSQEFIPSALLIHEYFAYTRPINRFKDALLWCNAAVFPTKILQENAISAATKESVLSTYILPQGKCQIPFNLTNNNDIQLKRILKKYGDKKTFIILGAGSVEFRKGVDLFIATAAEIKSTFPSVRFKMIWVGHGFNPKTDASYSCFLAQQIEYSNLKDQFEFLDEVSDLESLYKISTIFYLPARLDPLPNVAIDTMMQGIPLICFEKGCGAAEFLEQDEDTKACVIPYMSIKAAAKQIVALYTSKEQYALISQKTKHLAEKHFNMKNYVSQLIELATKQIAQVKQESADCLTIASTHDFTHDFFMPRSQRTEAIRHYVRAWQSKINPLRKPMPGFNPFSYHQFHPQLLELMNPFADYLLKGKPLGPWQDKVITAKKNAVQPSKQPRLAIHIHATDTEGLNDILKRLHQNQTNYDIFLSTSAAFEAESKCILSTHPANNCYFHASSSPADNHVSSFLTQFGLNLQAYDVIAHLHTIDKPNLEYPCDTVISMKFLLESLIGRQYAMLDQILLEFSNNPKLGLVFPDDPHLFEWGECKNSAEQLSMKLKLSELPTGRFNFPIGMMFFARPKALQSLLSPNLTEMTDVEHYAALERLIPCLVKHQGFEQAVTYVPNTIH